ncbi:hypothetical protein [Sulfitobacter sp. W074]|uniref:hypothetical protein n=1 Tax=Sulfitobacter sp. W074 TaxID=2867026 RepID=UPI0021A3C1E0|nr:hypothetical protein [Sulfitobacter sp. W074]UWR38371.1 hypothetical protein K3762_04890 [Sulfitobacter sp. W074]
MLTKNDYIAAAKKAATAIRATREMSIDAQIDDVPVNVCAYIYRDEDGVRSVYAGKAGTLGETALTVCKVRPSMSLEVMEQLIAQALEAEEPFMPRHTAFRVTKIESLEAATTDMFEGYDFAAAAEAAADVACKAHKIGEKTSVHAQVHKHADGKLEIIVAPEDHFDRPSVKLCSIYFAYRPEVDYRIHESLLSLFREMPDEFVARCPIYEVEEPMPVAAETDAKNEESNFGISWEEFQEICPLPADIDGEFTEAELAEAELSDYFFSSFGLSHLSHEGHRMTISVSVPNSDGTFTPFLALHPDDFENLQFAMEGLQDLVRDVSEMIDAPVEIHTQHWIDGRMIASPTLHAHTPQMMHAEVHDSDLRRQGSDRRSIARMCRHMRLYRPRSYLTTPPIVRDMMEALQVFKFSS